MLNLFAYTGAASVVARSANAEVVHCDASRPGINWANQNMQLNGLADPELQARLAGFHRNFELRLYNPIFRQAKVSPLEFAGGIVFRFRDLNRRMHNKLMLVDDRIGIIGGRNIQDEYFDWKDDYNYRDRDLLVAGPVTRAKNSPCVHEMPACSPIIPKWIAPASPNEASEPSRPIGMLMVANLLNISGDFVRNRYTQQYAHWLRLRLIGRIAARPYADFLQSNSGVLLKKVMGEATRLLNRARIEEQLVRERDRQPGDRIETIEIREA